MSVSKLARQTYDNVAALTGLLLPLHSARWMAVGSSFFTVFRQTRSTGLCNVTKVVHTTATFVFDRCMTS